MTAVRAAIWMLSAFAASSILLSALFALTSGPLCTRISHWGCVARSRTLLALRMLPAMAGVWVAAAVVLPSYLVFEPNETAERISLIGAAVASVGVALVAAGAWRAANAVLQLRRVSHAWSSGAVPFTWPGVPLPVLIAESAPAMTLIGLSSPVILVSRALTTALTAEELNAAFEHEFAHRRAWDNTKRLMIVLLPDVLFLFAGGRRLEQQWAAAVEECADEQAAWDPKARLAMASALVKAARLPLGARTVLASPLVDGDVVAVRVERLLDGPAPISNRRKSQLIATALLLVLGYGAFSYVAPFRTIHYVSEEILEDLP
jgi:Zn-dependent protease with chaperone function